MFDVFEAAALLEQLNPQQRAAVLHPEGTGDCFGRCWQWQNSGS